MRYRISEFAQFSGISAKTLRYYDEVGLLSPAAVDARSRYRYYGASQLAELNLILALRDFGMSIREIRSLLTNASPGSQRKALEGLRRDIQSSFLQSQRILRLLDAHLSGTSDLPSIAVRPKRLPAMRVSSLRARVNGYDEISAMQQELATRIPEEWVGPTRGVLWHRCADSGVLEGEPFLELKARAPRNLPSARELPSATLACAFSADNDTDAERAYDAIRQWMRVQGSKLTGPKRELVRGNVLEIQFPVA